MNDSIEKKIKGIQRLFFIFFFYILFEGAVRKWLFPNLSIEVILIRDFLVILMIISGFKNQIYNLNSMIEKSILFWTILILFWLVVQLIFVDLKFGIALIGIRNWVLYFWFSVLFFRVFNSSNKIEKFISKIVYTIIPISLLVLFQHFLPVEHFINKQIGVGSIYQFAPGIVRVTGTFSFAYGYGLYISFVTPF